MNETINLTFEPYCRMQPNIKPCIIGKKKDDPLVENPKNFWKIFFILGVGGKKPPPPWGILGFLRHFGQQTVATHKPQS